MTGPVPAEEAFEHFNALVHLTSDEPEAVRAVRWKLLLLVNKQPGNVLARIALTRAETLLGDAKAALAQTDAVWNARHQLPPEPAQSFAHQLLWLGSFDRYLHWSSEQPDPVHNALKHQRIVERLSAYWGLGDLQSVREQVNLAAEILGSPDENWLEFFSVIKEAGLEEHFQRHRSIIESFGSEWHVHRALVLMREEECSPAVTTFYYGPGDRRERGLRLDDCYDAVMASYDGTDADPILAWELMAPTFLSYHAAPSRRDVVMVTS